MKFPTPREATTYRFAKCQEIAREVRRRGYDCDWHKVNRNYIIFRRWYDQRLALGYLINQVGLKKLPQRAR